MQTPTNIYRYELSIYILYIHGFAFIMTTETRVFKLNATIDFRLVLLCLSRFILFVVFVVVVGGFYEPNTHTHRFNKSWINEVVAMHSNSCLLHTLVMYIQRLFCFLSSGIWRANTQHGNGRNIDITFIQNRERYNSTEHADLQMEKYWIFPCIFRYYLSSPCILWLLCTRNACICFEYNV